MAIREHNFNEENAACVQTEKLGYIIRQLMRSVGDTLTADQRKEYINKKDLQKLRILYRHNKLKNQNFILFPDFYI